MNAKRNWRKWIEKLWRQLRLRALLMPLLVLIGLITFISCQSTKAEGDIEHFYTSALVSMMPALPTVPVLPELHWVYLPREGEAENEGEAEGLYAINSEDADAFLNYGENILPEFIYELEVYKRKMDIIIEYLAR